MRLRLSVVSICSAVMAAMIIAVPSKGEYYQYKDHNGYVVFTDNLASVPEDKLDEAEAGAHREILSEPSTAQGLHAVDTRQVSIAGEGTWERNLKNQTIALDAERASLEKRFEKLCLEQASLEKSPGPDASSGEKNAYQDRIEALNKKITVYETDREQFDKKVAEFTAVSLIGR